LSILINPPGVQGFTLTWIEGTREAIFSFREAPLYYNKPKRKCSVDLEFYVSWLVKKKKEKGKKYILSTTYQTKAREASSH
jgi:hypothetical protein